MILMKIYMKTIIIKNTNKFKFNKYDLKGH